MEKDGETAPVSVLTSPELTSGCRPLKFRVVVDRQTGDVVADLVVKPVLVEPEG